MNRVIKCSKKKISIILNATIFFLILINIPAFIFLWEYKEFVYFFSALLCSCAIFGVIYRYRYFPVVLVIVDGTLDIEYSDKHFFNPKSFNGNIKDLSLTSVAKNLVLYKGKKIITKIPDSSISTTDKQFLITLFDKNEKK